MPTSSHRLPPNLEYGLRQIARRHQRRLRLRGQLKFAVLFIAILGLLAVVLPITAKAYLPFVLPIGTSLLVLACGAYRWLYTPRRQTPSIENLALLVDAHYPQLENLAISSVEFSQRAGDSEWIVAQILERARRETGAIDLDQLTDIRPLRPLALGGALLWAISLGLFAGLLYHWDPARLGRGFFTPLAYEITFIVEPGDALIERGNGQTIWIRRAPLATDGALRWRQAGGQWQTAPLAMGRSERIRFFQFDDLQADIEYQVQLGSGRSPVYRLTVWTPPAVATIDLSYTYPDYLQLPPRTVPDGGHLAGPEGTLVTFEVAVNKPLAQAHLVLTSGTHIQLTAIDDHHWRGQLELKNNEQYHLELRDLDQRTNADPTLYDIVVNPDNPPTIRAQLPRGDDEATPLEEIPFALAVSDDYGIADYGLQYEVAGRNPVRLSFKDAISASERAEAQHLLYLEELDLHPGDLVTWTFWATDHKANRDDYETLGDPYFLEIRPYTRTFRQATSNAGANAGANGQPGGEAADQKQIIIATWNLRRDAGQLVQSEFAQRRERLIAAQQQVVQSALANRPPAGKEHLPEALQREVNAALNALAAATWPTPTAALTTAMTHQRRAYRYMLQLAPEASQVAQATRQGQVTNDPERRRELDALETTRRRDFSEESSTLASELAATTAARQSIEELAQRQQFINQDAARLVSELEQQQENEEAKRQLEKLREEQRRNLEALDQLGGQIASSDMAQDQAQDAQQQLAAARRQMRESAERLADGTPQRARAAGQRALEALKQADQDLGQLTRRGATERLGQLRADLAALRDEQAALDRDSAEPREALATAFAEFMAEAGELAEQSTTGQPLMARKLGDWLRQTSRQGVYEDLQRSAEQARYGSTDQIANLDAQVAQKLQRAASTLDSVALHLITDDLQARRQALAELEQIVDAQAPPQDPAAMEDFAASGYREWVEALRNVEDLLPSDSEAGNGLSDIRGDLGAMHRRYRREGQVPSYDLVYDRAVKPLQLKAAALQREIDRLLDQRGPLESQDVIPTRYRTQVAEYFERLSSLEDD